MGEEEEKRRVGKEGLHLKPGARSLNCGKHTLLSTARDSANLLLGKKTRCGVDVWVSRTV